MGNDQQKMHVESLKWMISLGLLNDPQVKNHIILNAYDVDEKIQDVQLLIDTNKQKLLIYVDIKSRWWTRQSTIDNIIENVTIRLTEMVPSFQLRVINNLDLFKKSLKIATNS